MKDEPFVEDSSIPNESSISFLFEYQGKKILFLADSHPTAIAKFLKENGYSRENQLEVDLVKVSHHGSKMNVSPELLETIRCRDYLISTNGKRHAHPDKAALARIITSNSKKTRLYFNYDIAKKIFLRKDYDDFDFECILLEDLENNTIKLV